MSEDKDTTLQDLAAEGEAIMTDLPDDAEGGDPNTRRGLPSEGVVANAAANALHAGGATGIG